MHVFSCATSAKASELLPRRVNADDAPAGRSVPARPWVTLLLFAVCALLSLDVIQGLVVRSFELTRSGLSRGEFWRLWTSSLVHFGPVHAGVDALTLLVGGVWFERRLGRVVLVSCLLLVAPLTSGVVLVLDPGVQVIRGASALAVFLIAAAWFEFWLRRSVSRPALVILAVAFVARQVHTVASEQVGWASGWGVTVTALPPEVAPAAYAHLMAAALSGLVMWRVRYVPR